MLLIILFPSMAIGQITVTNDGLALTVQAGLTATIEGEFVNQTNGANLGTINNAGTISLTHNWTNNSANTVFTPNTGTVEFISTTRNDSIGGSNATNFDNLTLNNSFSSGEEFYFSHDVTVRETLTMTAGNVHLNNNTLTIGQNAGAPGGLVHSKTSASGFIHSGIVIRNIGTGLIPDGDLAGFFPMGTDGGKYRPYFLSAPATGPTTGGTYTIQLVEAPISNPTTPVTVADDINIETRHNGYWSASAAGIVGGTYEINAGGTNFGTISSIANIRLMLLNSVVGSPGVNAGTPANIQVKRTGLSLANISNNFHLGTVDSTASPLPIELLYFTAKLNLEGYTDIFWTTASEINNLLFVLEKSYDGIYFESIYETPGAGTSFEVNHYHTIDLEKNTGTIYYRLKQIDFDGSATYSHLEIINNKKLDNISVFPVPAFNSNITIVFNNQRNQSNNTIKIFNNNGQVLLEDILLKEQTTYVINKNVFNSSGVYYVEIIGEVSFIKKIIYYQ